MILEYYSLVFLINLFLCFIANRIIDKINELDSYVDEDYSIPFKINIIIAVFISLFYNISSITLFVFCVFLLIMLVVLYSLYVLEDKNFKFKKIKKINNFFIGENDDK